MVYSLLLHIPNAVDVGGVHNERPRLDLSVLRICRQIHAEAAHHLYSANTFCFVEHCDAFEEDGNAVAQNPGRAWLRAIGPANARSLRHLQLRLRRERPVSYYVGLLADIAALAPNLARLAIVPEQHQQIQVTYGEFEMHKMEGKCVVPLSDWEFHQLVSKGLRRFRDLKLVMFAGRQREATVDKMCLLLPPQCRVRCISGTDALRDKAGCYKLWNRTAWYDAGLSFDRVVRWLRRPGKGEEEYKELKS
ncbi:hypothetical protein VTK56DRAFT_1268 [Thermocarpiscus australiensis]